MIDLPNLKDLEKVINLCRKKGVSAITIGEIRLELREEAPPSNYKRQIQETVDDTNSDYNGFPDGELTPEQLMFYSSGGRPENDPALKGDS